MKYTVMAEKANIAGKACTTYGIRGENGHSTADFHDVSVEQSFVERIADRLNSNSVELCHFRDVVIDELNR